MNSLVRLGAASICLLLVGCDGEPYDPSTGADRAAASEFKSKSWVRDVLVTPDHMNVSVTDGEMNWNSVEMGSYGCGVLRKHSSNLKWLRYVDSLKANTSTQRDAEITKFDCNLVSSQTNSIPQPPATFQLVPVPTLAPSINQPETSLVPRQMSYEGLLAEKDIAIKERRRYIDPEMFRRTGQTMWFDPRQNDNMVAEDKAKGVEMERQARSRLTPSQLAQIEAYKRAYPAGQPNN